MQQVTILWTVSLKGLISRALRAREINPFRETVRTFEVNCHVFFAVQHNPEQSNLKFSLRGCEKQFEKLILHARSARKIDFLNRLSA
jgi:hypothetical protein